MFEVYAILAICTLLAYQVTIQTDMERNDGIFTRFRDDSTTMFLLLFIFVTLVLFAGLRTRMNDTATYILNFQRSVPDSANDIFNISWKLGDNPLFELYQRFIKTFISSSGNSLIFITAIIVEVSIIQFMYMYSYDFGISTYIFITFTVLAFTMAALKQSLSMAIAIWAIPEISRYKVVKPILIIVIASLIHPYVMLTAVAFLFTGRGVWNRNIYILMAVTMVIMLTFNSFIQGVLSVTDVIGEGYELSSFEQGTGVGIPRIAAYAIVPFFSFISRNELREHSEPLQDLFVNLSLIAFFLSLVSRIGGSVLIGRLPNYFGIYICMSLPYVLCSNNSFIERNRNWIFAFLFVAYLFFYHTYYKRYFIAWDIHMFDSVYNRITFGELLQRW